MARHWHSPAAALLTHVTGIGDPPQAMEHLVGDLLRDVDVRTPPIDLRVVGSFQHVNDIRLTEMAHAGRLVPEGKGFVIQVNARHSQGKRNFTVGHEIGHTLLPSYRRKPRLIEDLHTGLYDDRAEEEYLCDVAGAELLMPMSLFRPRAATFGFHLNAVAALARDFQASREAAAIRLVETDLWPGAMAVWQLAYKPSQHHIVGRPTLPGLETYTPQKELRVRYAVHGPRFGYYLHRHLAAPADGCLARCYRDGGIIAGEEEFELGHRSQRLYVIAGAVDFVGEDGPTRQILSLHLAPGAGLPKGGPQLDLWAAAEE